MKRTVFLSLFILHALSFVAQIKDSYKAEMFGSAATSEHTPFWMVNRNWGMVPLKAGNFYTRGGIFHEQQINRDWSLDAGLDIVGATSSNYGHFWIQQIYGRLNWKIWRMDIGTREDYTSLLNPKLSSGDFAKSNNARPIPEIKFSIPEFQSIPFTKGNAYLKGEFALGYYLDSKWREKTARPYNQDYTTDVLSHHKSIYFRFGNIETGNRLQFTVGMDHIAQWGGNLYKYRPVDGQWQYRIQKQPHEFDDLFRVCIAKEGSESSSLADKAYVAGSHWGAYPIRLDYQLTNDKQLSIYTNHFFEDGSGMTFENYRDGLFGLEYKTKDKSWLSGAVFEYIYTKQQTGPIHHNLEMDNEHRSKLISKGNGNDNYYNNTDYVESASYYGKTMGTPLFLSPEYNTDGSVIFKSSRIIAFHLGLEGYLHSSLQYRLLLTTGRTWGTYYIPYTAVKRGFASGLELIYRPTKIEGLDVQLSIGCDKDEFFGGNTFGGGITLVKRGVVHILDGK